MNAQAESQYAVALRDELVKAATRQNRLRRRRRAIVKVGAGCVVVLGVIVTIVGVFVSPGQDAATAKGTVRVTPQQDTTLVEIVVPERPDEVLSDLRAAGLMADRVDRPTGPSRVGRVVSVAVDGNSTPTGNQNGFLSATVDSSARILLGVGVAVPPGTDYEVNTNAFDDGEPLHCRSWPGQLTDQLATVTGGLKIGVVDDTGPTNTLPMGKVVRSATALASDRVLVSVGDGPVAPRPVACTAAPGQG